MKKFDTVLENMGFEKCIDCKKYCRAGKTFYVQNEFIEGYYWFYETDEFIIDIHDFFIKKELFVDSFPDMNPYMEFSSSYIKTANGKCLNPYQNLASNTIFVASTKNIIFRFLLSANFPYYSVGISFKDNILKEYLFKYVNNSQMQTNIFFETKDLIVNNIAKIANSIINCNMSSPAAKIFFEAKAKEWLSITFNAYLNKKEPKEISKNDEISLENVTNYINDHLSTDISQELLEKIAMMSKTKLKNTFKQKYNLSITQYIQKTRMNVAENLLANTELEIKDIAKAVGYSSHSRFSTLYKKYKGIYPREVKKISSSKK